MNAFIAMLGATLVHFLWQGLLIGCATAVVLALLRNSRAEYRYLVACTALLACLAWPALGLVERLGNGAAAPGEATGMMQFAVRNMVGNGQLIDLGAAVRSIVSVWALCAAVLSVRMALGLLWIERTVQRNAGRHDPVQARWQARLSQMAQAFGITRQVRLRMVEVLASPVTAGWWRPVVLVPAALAARMPPDLLEALLAHELAHVRRHDYLVNLLQNVIETLLFYHPAVWWLSNRIRAERELIADDFAARQLGEPRRLALALSELERLQFSTHHLAQAANGGNLMDRIKHLMRPAPQALNWKAAIPMLGLALACVAIYAEATAAEATTAKGKTAKAVVNFDKCALPEWPAAAVAQQRTGKVVLGFLIAADGKVKSSKVEQSSGHADLDQAARTAIEKCSFIPATTAGKPVASWLKMMYDWNLK
ncbi:peptidase M56 [Duganella sp. Leaf61]|uniref:M56 family metallopeptidase n=1 Tax=Duganella sp. Leaf61 TaxID=1736227 RepID=UPI0006F4252F|nr:M56 family metallopeptidase [Duganella sp. Leaf61]KQN75924.1 peptidase M56 [Duganella sp. Leaf61]